MTASITDIECRGVHRRRRAAFFANVFKIPTLWGVARRAPYFHDNSAKSLEDVMEQYVFLFTSNIGFPITDSNILLTDQDIADIIAFMKLL